MTRPPITPGPWSISPEDVYLIETETWYIAAAHAFVGDGESTANARAIAALPDLLAALETALSVIEDLPYPANHPADNLRAALTKAGYTFP